MTDSLKRKKEKQHWVCGSAVSIIAVLFCQMLFREILMSMSNPTTLASIIIEDSRILLLDQRLLPHEMHYLDCRDAPSIAQAIREMAVRGAPAIGVASALAVALSAQVHAKNATADSDWRNAVAADINLLAASRPTAVNLHWALAKMQAVLQQEDCQPEHLKAEALAIWQADLHANAEMARLGSAILAVGAKVLTHCNTGSLATSGIGTALGVIIEAAKQGKIAAIYADETRPWLQGSRLTAFELQYANLPFTLICEGAAGFLMQKEGIHWVIVGADRIAANGDTANKVGTYNLALLAKAHGAQLMVVAPTATIDQSLESGHNIPIEERPAEEITVFAGKAIAPAHCQAWNPVFDITPAALIDVLVTEKGVIYQPNKYKIATLFEDKNPC
jgi:methylthioribose-1-phosphate isomerase